mmetsp:Transcript_43972/g.129539  ORF Transcript_43972/g.129539 Transcript_43972/m.129539 type:complete len:249 (+) Transcript_43972:3173-3919(+)
MSDLTLDLSCPARNDPLDDLRWRHRVCICHQDQLGHVASVIEPHTPNAKEHHEHHERKNDEEYEDTISGAAKAIRFTNLWGSMACLHNQYAYIDEDESLLHHSHQRAILNPPKRLDGDMKCEERDADEKRDENSCQLRALADQQHPPGERQLPAHLEHLPPERADHVISRQEGSRAAQRRLVPRLQCVSACPEEHTIQDGDANRPHENKDEGGGLQLPVFFCIATRGQIVVQVPPCLTASTVVLDCVA